MQDRETFVFFVGIICGFIVLFGGLALLISWAF